MFYTAPSRAFARGDGACVMVIVPVSPTERVSSSTIVRTVAWARRPRAVRVAVSHSVRVCEPDCRTRTRASLCSYVGHIRTPHNADVKVPS